MNLSIKQITFLFLILAGCSQPEASRVSNINQEVEEFVQAKMEELKIPGLAIAVIRDGAILKKSVYGFGNLEWKNKVTEHSNFQIASSTKLLTSTLLLKAIYQKKIDLDEPISTYLDSIPGAWGEIRIKHLIGHTSGLPDDIFEDDLYQSTEELVQQLMLKPLLFDPGTNTRYGQAEFSLLSHILEKIYRKPFVEIIRDEVTTPLDMNDGSYDMEENIQSPLGGSRYLQTEQVREKVTTYYEYDGRLVNYKTLYPQYGYSAAAYYASITDFANWAIGLDRNTLFPADFADSLIYRQDEQALFSKVGWVVATEDEIVYGGHPGGPGLGDVLRFPEEKITIIVLSNDGELLPGMARAIASWYVKGLSPKYEVEKFER